MQERRENYLKSRNILYIILAWCGVVFLNPSANSWMEYLDENLEYHFSWLLIIEAVFIMFCFSYKAIIDRDLRRIFVLSVIGLVSWSVSSYLIIEGKSDNTVVAFFHPISLSLAAIFAIERKFKLMFVGYLIGYYFSLTPLMVSLVPILFLQLWFSSLSTAVVSSKLSRFLSRSCMYYVIMLTSISLHFHVLLAIEVNFFIVAISLLIIGILYYMLNQYLNEYYSSYGNRGLKILSYIPVLWVIPLFEILINGRPISKVRAV